MSCRPNVTGRKLLFCRRALGQFDKAASDATHPWRAVRLRVMCALFALLGGTALGIEPALVALDARDVINAGAPWKNMGVLGGVFVPIGKPSIQIINGVRAIRFDGTQDAYRGPSAPAAIAGDKRRAIEVWAYNADVGGDEETLVSWGKRGGPAGSLMAFGWGRNTVYGAASHWAEDLGWSGVPRARRWHYLVYTYDGATARVYDNGVPKGERAGVHLDTPSGTPIVIAAENGAN